MRVLNALGVQIIHHSLCIGIFHCYGAGVPHRSDIPSTDAADSTGRVARSPVFVTTHWSVVLSAAGSDTPRARAALDQLCQSYWHPLYHFVRRHGMSPHDAEDLTQEFFARFLQRHSVSSADPARGRFRSFLLSSLKHFLADERDKARAQKRGRGQVLAVDFQSEEARLLAEQGSAVTPDKAFDRRWAVALLEKVYQQLEAEAQAHGRAAQLTVLRDALMGGRGEVPYSEFATRLGISEGAARVAVHRLRQRYREVLREAIADTVSDPAEVDAELRYLLEVLS